MPNPRVRMIRRDDASPEAQALWDQQIDSHGRMTNMKMTLARSPASLRALMCWYELKDLVCAFLGERRTILFVHAISSQTDCLICSTFFRRILQQWGENPDKLKLDGADQAIVDLGQAIARDSNGVPDQIYENVKEQISDDQMVTLISFAGIMIATNIVNNVLRIPLDDYLAVFKKE